MGTKRVVALALLVGILTLASRFLPTNTTVNVFGLLINVVPILTALDPFLGVGLILAGISAWGHLLIRGRAGEVIQRLAKKFEPAFVFMVPAIVTYIIVFVALAIRIPYVWDRFQLFFQPGLFGILLLFTWRDWIGTAQSTWRSIVDFYEWIKPLKYRKNIIRPNPTPWWSFLIDAIALFWIPTAIPYVAVTTTLSLSQNGIPDLASLFMLTLKLLVAILVTFLLLWRRWRYSQQLRPVVENVP